MDGSAAGGRGDANGHPSHHLPCGRTSGRTVATVGDFADGDGAGDSALARTDAVGTVVWGEFGATVAGADRLAATVFGGVGAKFHGRIVSARDDAHCRSLEAIGTEHCSGADDGTTVAAIGLPPFAPPACPLAAGLIRH